MVEIPCAGGCGKMIKITTLKEWYCPSCKEKRLAKQKNNYHIKKNGGKKNDRLFETRTII